MKCIPFSHPDFKAIVCTSGREPVRRCSACGKTTRDARLCDWPLGQHRGTCDAVLCTACTHSPTPGKDVCPMHRQERERRIAAQAARQAAREAPPPTEPDADAA